MKGNTLTPSRLTRIALIGNPNTGKSSLFNALTGLRQKTGNFPGVTVDKKTGRFTHSSPAAAKTFEITDLPGTYSLIPSSPDEQVTTRFITNHDQDALPDCVLVIADATQLKRSLLICTQVIDLGLPTVLALNMSDIAQRKGITILVDVLSAQLGVPVVAVDARSGTGISRLKEVLSLTNQGTLKAFHPGKKQSAGSHDIPYLKDLLLQVQQQLSHGPDLDENTHEAILEDTRERQVKIDRLVDHIQTRNEGSGKDLTTMLDGVLTHPLWGYLIFLGLMLLIFQAIFSWAQWPMDLIDMGMTNAGIAMKEFLPDHFISRLLVDGVWAGLSGILVFVPQIALLFTFIGLLEDSGYMARVSMIMDRLMRSFGLGGRSVIPLIGGMACAIPAIMSTRIIGHARERLITTLVIPFTTCSARLPVYTLLISLVIPEDQMLGPFNLQGLVFLGLYLLGFAMALLAAAILHLLFRKREKSVFIMEIPEFRRPHVGNILNTVLEKVRIFVTDAGKIIIGVSMVLWFLSSYGPTPESSGSADPPATTLETSWAGQIGKTIEPVIKPLGFDWKIGIALITSFAAREIFVGTMATLYSIEDQDNEQSLRQKLLSERIPGTNKPRYTLAVGLSLMIFYAFALQCVSTLAVVYRETKSLKWPILQFSIMGILAYFASLITYQLFS
ncbi:MAG: ferrous iron transport protein B [Flavobacteriales bacterium]|nr:ferrous iron transport protein B [Flavobacteriales bacterium]